MNIKTIIVSITLVVIFLFFPKNVVAQAGGGTCEGGAACSCDPSADPDSCCAGALAQYCGGPEPTPGPGGGGGGGGGYDPQACNAPRNVNCPANTSCVPSGQYYCNTYNINYNSYSTAVFGSPNGNADCVLGNAQTSSSSCNPWFCGNTIYTYACCPAGTVSQYYYSQGADYTVTVNNCEGGQPYNCYPGSFVSTTPISQCGTTPRDEEGQRHPIYIYRTTCRPEPTKINVCTTICTTTSPSTPTPLTPTNGSTVSSTTVSLTWNSSSQTWGDACGTQTNQYRVYVGTSPSSLGLIGTVGSGTSSTNFSGSSGQTYYWRVDATNGAQTTSSSVWQFTINSGPWWQTKDGSATTNNSLSSTVPTGSYFSVVGLGGFSGVPVYGGTFNLSSTPTLISTRSWNANTTTIQPRLFNYSYFNNLIPDDVNDNIVIATDASLRSNGYSSDGYEWFKSNGSLSIDSDIDFGNRKVIVFVENGDLNINGKINLTDGLGFVGFFIEGDMTISSSVTGAPSIEGIYEVDGNFENSAGTSQLHARGSIAVFGGVSLSRSLTNNTNPAELFEFAPDLMFNYPKALGFRRSKWQEIAP